MTSSPMTPREAFAQHGLDHVSASQINSYAAEPALWLMEKVLKRTAPVGYSAHRGTAVEAGVTHGLLYPDKPIDLCQELGNETYRYRCGENGIVAHNEKRASEGLAVAPTIAVAIHELRRYGIPDLVQRKVVQDLGEDLPPLVGTLDFGWSKHGIILDLKTELRLTSEPKAAHARQVAGYVHGTNHEGRLCYATPRKIGVYVVEDVRERFAEMVEITRRMGRFLALSKDPEELAGLLVPDADDFRWNNDTARKNRIAVYGM